MSSCLLSIASTLPISTYGEREREARESERARERARERERESVCVCVREREREREKSSWWASSGFKLVNIPGQSPTSFTTEGHHHGTFQTFWNLNGVEDREIERSFYREHILSTRDLLGGVENAFYRQRPSRRRSEHILSIRTHSVDKNTFYRQQNTFYRQETFMEASTEKSNWEGLSLRQLWSLRLIKKCTCFLFGKTHARRHARTRAHTHTNTCTRALAYTYTKTGHTAHTHTH